MKLLNHFASALRALQWRSILLTVLLLTLINYIFLDDTLRTVYSTRLDKHRLTKLRTPTTIAPFEDGDVAESVALCIAVKDQYEDMTEFLVHHYHHLNVRRFYIMDDGSSPPLATRDYSQFIDPRAITHRYYLRELHEPYQQLQMYRECVQLFGHKHKWIGFLDADEFLEVKFPETLQEVLGAYDDDDTVGAFGVNWIMHNSAGLLTRPASARQAFTSCIADPSPDHPIDVGIDNEHTKVFVKPTAFKHPGNPHMMLLHDGYRTVGEKNDTLDRMAWRVPITRDRIALHHYAVKSRGEYEAKIARSNGMGAAKDWGFWDHIEEMERYECKEMSAYNP